MIAITKDISLEDRELTWHFTRASGPGGQKVNKTATAAQLRFDVRTSPSLPDDVRRRLIRLAGRRLTEDGILIIQARRFRTQERNRQDALERLIALIRLAAEPPRPRKKTRPTAAARRRRLESKRRRGAKKRQRGPVRPDGD